MKKFAFFLLINVKDFNNHDLKRFLIQAVGVILGSNIK